jgi:hypothetical protein
MLVISENRARYLMEIERCRDCRKAELYRSATSPVTTSKAICGYHYEKGLTIK